jgi:N-formylglutamate amidohydrolase
MTDWLHIVEGPGPIVATAIHDGHGMRPEIADLMALSEANRLREEDPYSAPWTEAFGTRLVPGRSRFEVDLNRTRDGSVYRTPNHAWGLDLWARPLSDEVVADSLAQYDHFYAEMRRILDDKQKRHGSFVVLDLHTYNHRRGGPDAPAGDPAGNPEVNVGTGSLDPSCWGVLIDRFIADVEEFDFLGRTLDVKENVRFRGGYLSKWVHENYPQSGCCLAVELKKFFMDEWTGDVFDVEHRAISRALAATSAGLIESLSVIG